MRMTDAERRIDQMHFEQCLAALDDTFRTCKEIGAASGITTARLGFYLAKAHGRGLVDVKFVQRKDRTGLAPLYRKLVQ